MIKFKFNPLPLLSLLVFLLMGFKTKQDIGQNRPLNGHISFIYHNTESPLLINYVIHPYGGSNSYEYSWKIKNQDAAPYNDIHNFQYTFNCNVEERPEVEIYCSIKDKVTGKTITTKLRHPIEYCNQNN